MLDGRMVIVPRKTKRKSKKKSDKAIAKDAAWTAFSRYIRLASADDNGNVQCVTCGIVKHWTGESMQAGHFIDSRNNTVLFDERIVFCQCYSCNVPKKGNKVAYTIFMHKLGYTMEEIEEFESLKFKTKKMSTADFVDVKEEYTKKFNKLSNKD